MAVHEKVIQKDFTTFAKAISQNKGIEKNKFLEFEEYKIVIVVSKNKMDVQSYTMIYLIAITGMRFAECLGLAWESVDNENKVLVVDKIWNYKTNLDFASIKQKAVSERYRLTMRHLNC